MLVRKLVFALLAVLTVSIGVTGQEQPATTVKHVRLKSVPPTLAKTCSRTTALHATVRTAKGTAPRQRH